MLHTWVLQLDPKAVEGGGICINFKKAKCAIEGGGSESCTNAAHTDERVGVAPCCFGSASYSNLSGRWRAKFYLLPSCR